eukprot:1153545-Pelagomonas_calceolata.AAC.1
MSLHRIAFASGMDAFHFHDYTREGSVRGDPFETHDLKDVSYKFIPHPAEDACHAASRHCGRGAIVCKRLDGSMTHSSPFPVPHRNVTKTIWFLDDLFAVRGETEGRQLQLQSFSCHLALFFLVVGRPTDRPTCLGRFPMFVFFLWNRNSQLVHKAIKLALKLHAHSVRCAYEFASTRLALKKTQLSSPRSGKGCC